MVKVLETAVGGGVAYGLGLCHICWSSCMVSVTKRGPSKSTSLGVTLVKHHPECTIDKLMCPRKVPISSGEESPYHTGMASFL